MSQSDICKALESFSPRRLNVALKSIWPLSFKGPNTRDNSTEEAASWIARGRDTIVGDIVDHVMARAVHPLAVLELASISF